MVGIRAGCRRLNGGGVGGRVREMRRNMTPFLGFFSVYVLNSTRAHADARLQRLVIAVNPRYARKLPEDRSVVVLVADA